jgi:hypothetical protein
MKQCLLILIAILIFNTFVEAYCIPENQKSFAKNCISEILNCRYNEALRLADSASQANKEDPLAPILRLIAIGVRDVDFDTVTDSAGFFHAYENAVKLTGLYEKQHGESSYTTMLLGFCKGLNASFYLRLDSYFDAMQTGFDALRLLDDSYALDTSNADALLFPGLYDYAKGELKKKLWWVLFWYQGSKAEGIERLWKCANYGQLTSTASLLALVDIHVRDKNPVECLPIVNRLEKECPKSRFTLWAKAKYLESCPQYIEAAEVFAQLAISYAADPAGSHGELETRNRQAHMLFLAGHAKEAAEICRAIVPRALGKRNKLIYKDTNNLLRQINDHEN